METMLVTGSSLTKGATPNGPFSIFWWAATTEVSFLVLKAYRPNITLKWYIEDISDHFPMYYS